jgi:nitrate/TMAO reductase-like tetraheme cytochrome c subunit
MPEHTSSMQEGAELWSMACSHCHNIRPADQYASEQWPIIVNHMRTRAGLTRSEANTIAAFLLELRRVEEGSR